MLVPKLGLCELYFFTCDEGVLTHSTVNFLDSGTGFREFNYADEACVARDY